MISTDNKMTQWKKKYKIYLQNFDTTSCVRLSNIFNHFLAAKERSYSFTAGSQIKTLFHFSMKNFQSPETIFANEK